MHLVSHVEQHSEIIVAKHIDNVISLEKNRMLEWQANVNGAANFQVNQPFAVENLHFVVLVVNVK